MKTPSPAARWPRTLWMALVLSVAGCAPAGDDDQGAPTASNGPAVVAGQPAVSTTEPVAQVRPAAVAMPEPHAREVAADVLRRGGNAVDAAVAAGFVLAVTLPQAGNIGGGGFMTLYQDGVAHFLDYRETAPSTADRDMFLDRDGEVLAEASLTGYRAVGVPGTVAGLWEAHQTHGRLPWAELLEPAVRLARDGFVVPESLAASAAEERARLEDTNFERYFGDLRAGTVFRQPELGDTLERIAHEGPDEFYRGHTAALIVAEMNGGGGLVKAADLVGYRPQWRDPVSFDWRGYRVLTAPPPSSGGIAIAQFLKMYDVLQADFSELDHNSAAFVHLKAEIEKRIFADRARFLGDPDFIDVPLKRLLDDSYLEDRARGIDSERISPPEALERKPEALHTTHFSVLDGEGNAVSNTYTLNASFGSGVVVGGAGFLLNGEMDDFAVAPGVPNAFGVVGDEANAIEPGKRMLSSMSPTIALRDGDVAMVLGGMGGPAIFTSVYQVMLNLVVYGMSAPEAVAAPRFHHQLLPPDLITVVPGDSVPESTVSGLEKLGYRVEPHAFRFGDVQLIWKPPKGTLQAASDPRFSGESEVLEIAVE